MNNETETKKRGPRHRIKRINKNKCRFRLNIYAFVAKGTLRVNIDSLFLTVFESNYLLARVLVITSRYFFIPNPNLNKIFLTILFSSTLSPSTQNARCP